MVMTIIVFLLQNHSFHPLRAVPSSRHRPQEAEENGRGPMQADVLYDRELKERFGPWSRMLERAGTRPVAQSYIDKKCRRKEKRERHKEYRRQIREQEAAGAVQAE